jgi:ankyrin repeat protein
MKRRSRLVLAFVVTGVVLGCGVWLGRLILNVELVKAAASGDVPKADRLLALGADIKARDYHLFTALDWAAIRGDNAMAQLLLRRGADPNAASGNGMTPIATAARRGQVGVLRLLLAHGGHADVRDVALGTPLQAAAGAQSKYWHNSNLVMVLLLQQKVDVNAQDEDGQTALMLAVETGSVEAVRLLLNAGADPWSRSKDGRRAEQYLSGGPADRKIKELLSSNAARPRAQVEPPVPARAQARQGGLARADRAPSPLPNASVS